MLPALAKRIDSKIEKKEVVEDALPQAAIVSAALKALNFAQAKRTVEAAASNDDLEGASKAA
jgi:Arc/MetJ family transcription regulator